MRPIKGNRQSSRIKNVGLLATLFITCFMMFLAGCRNVLDSHDSPENGTATPVTGILSLTINGHGEERTIMPAPLVFNGFNLWFVDSDDPETGKAFEISWDGTSAVELYEGTWDLRVTAYMDGYNVARSRWYEDIEVLHNTPVSHTVMLLPIGYGYGQGTFSWDISFPINITSARMEIATLGDSGSVVSSRIYYFHGGLPLVGNISSLELDVGQYRVILTLHYGEEVAMLIAILHVYKNLVSHFEEGFTLAHFPVSLLDFVLASWNGEEWVFDDAERGTVMYWHFYALGINGVDEDNFDTIVEGFNYLTTDDIAPTNLAELKVLIDATLVGLASIDTYVYWHMAAVEGAIRALIASANNSWLGAFTWSEDGLGVTARIAGTYTVRLYFGDPILPRLAGMVFIYKTPVEVGRTLTANPSLIGVDGAISFQWERGTYPDFTPIYGAIYPTYDVQIADEGYTIRVIVYRVGNAGYVYSWPTAIVPPKLTGYFSIIGTPIVGMELEVDTSALRGTTEPLAFEWRRAGYTGVIGTDSTYIVQAADEGLAITVTVTRYGFSGSVTESVVIMQREGFHISLAEIRDRAPTIEGPAFGFLEVPETITVKGDFYSVRWFRGGTEITEWSVVCEDSRTLILDSSVHGNRIGRHFVTVVVVVNGVEYGQRISFTVLAAVAPTNNNHAKEE